MATNTATKEKATRSKQSMKALPKTIVSNAHYIAAHILVSDGLKIAVIGSETGELAAALSQIMPRANFVGVDIDGRAVTKANKSFKAKNLKFVKGNAATLPFEEGTIDVLINADILHDVYSNSRYNPTAISECLERQFDVLKSNGLMVILGHEKQARDSFVLLELSNNNTNDIQNLLDFSEQAHPVETSDCRGFFIEEQPPRFPNTSLYKLPLHWAHEFIIRKYRQADWGSESYSREYSFFSYQDYLKTLNELGGRVTYASPRWDEEIIDQTCGQHIGLYWENGYTAELPPTSFLVMCQKIGQRKSFKIAERRPIKNATFENLSITPVKNTQSFDVTDLLGTQDQYIDVLPYRISKHGELLIYLHHNAPTPLMNTVKRNGHNLTNKTWSGHVPAVLKIPEHEIQQAEKGGPRTLMDCIKKHTGLKPHLDKAPVSNGPSSFPAVNFINTYVQTKYVEVQAQKGRTEPETLTNIENGFSNNGYVTAFPAEGILNAIRNGYIPNMRLGVQITHLMKSLNMDVPMINNVFTPTLKEIFLKKTKVLDHQKLAEQLEHDEPIFKEARGRKGSIRLHKSNFVDTGYDGGCAIGLTSQILEFGLKENTSLNQAAILPICKNEDGQIFIAFKISPAAALYIHLEESFLPTLPKYDIPVECHTLHQAKETIAQHYETFSQNLISLGGQYFPSTDTSPQRIYPFILLLDNEIDIPEEWYFMPLKEAYEYINNDVEDSMLWLLEYAHNIYS